MGEAIVKVDQDVTLSMSVKIPAYINQPTSLLPSHIAFDRPLSNDSTFFKLHLPQFQIGDHLVPVGMELLRLR
jgi:hypothetical protein